MSEAKKDIARWRHLANEVRLYAEHMTSAEGRAEMIRAAENWESKAKEAEDALRVEAQRKT